VLVASSTTITISGTINANGGQGANTGCAGAGGGSGGAVRLMANTITGNGTISALGGSSTGQGNVSASAGRIRLEAFQQSFAGSISCGCGVISTPNSVALPASAPSSLTVTSINGISINANPFSFPDATINSSVPVTVNIQARYIPTGTVPNLTVFSESGPDQVITCTPLVGSLQSSTSTATVTFPSGGSRGFVKATWTQ
jgi:hypothetical protein